MKMDSAIDFRAWAKFERKVADHYLAMAALYLANDMPDTADIYKGSYEHHIKTALIWEKGADDLDANLRKEALTK